jgi:short subunit dehydrogenase-like uncharacterized protein
MRETWLLYGATGYTGRRIARNAVEKGAKPVLAGRREAVHRALTTQIFEGSTRVSAQRAMTHCSHAPT